MSGSMCSDRTSRLVYLQSDLIVTHTTQYTFSYIYIVHYLGLFILCKYVSDAT